MSDYMVKRLFIPKPRRTKDEEEDSENEVFMRLFTPKPNKVEIYMEAYIFEPQESYNQVLMPHESSKRKRSSTKEERKKRKKRKLEKKEERRLRKIQRKEERKMRKEEKKKKKELKARERSEVVFMNFMPMLPLLKAMSLHDQSYNSWCYSRFPNIRLVSQIFPRVSTLATLLISNEPFYHNYCNLQVDCISNLFVCYSSVTSVSNQNEEVVESPNTILERYLADFEEEFVNSHFKDFPQPSFSPQPISLNHNSILPFVEAPPATNVSSHSLIVGSQNPMIHDSIAVSHTPTPAQINTSFSCSATLPDFNPPNFSNLQSSSHNIIL